MCNCYTETLNICYDYFTHVRKDKKLKFGIYNMILQLCCQYYFKPLKDFTFTEKVIIVGDYSVITILKLRLDNNFNYGSCRDVCKYSMLLL